MCPRIVSTLFRSAAEIFHDRRRISNPGFARDIHQRFPIENSDRTPCEQRIAKSRRHSQRQIDLDPVPFKEIDQRRQGTVPAQQRHFDLMVRNALLAKWYPDLIIRFADRLLDVDRAVAEAWGRIQARVGRSIPAIDSLIAATAEVHDLTVVTRNVADFAPLIARVFSPWETGDSTS